MLEEDVLASKTKEELEVKDSLRSTLYRELYEREYKYVSDHAQSAAIGRSLDEEFLDDNPDTPPIPVDASSRGAAAIKPKSFIPATKINEDSMLPFGRGIDAPLG